MKHTKRLVSNSITQLIITNEMNKNIFLIALLSLLAACQHGQNKEILKVGINPIKVTTKTVELVKDNTGLRYSGTIEPSQSVALMFKSAGTVENVFVEEGDFVKKGEPLATVNKTTSQNLYNASKASYDQAKDAYDRLKTVHDEGSLTDIKWVEMETKLKQAESQMQITRSALDDCTLRAPDIGMIGRRDVEPGQSSIGISSPFVFVKIDRILVKISVPENEISKINKGMKASFSLSALGDQTFSGTVSKVGIVADRISRTYDVKILADNPGNRIKPGMVCDVILNLNQETVSLVVPYKAVSKDNDGKAFVFVVSPDGTRVIKQNITVGNYRESGIEVLSGLTPGQVVVSDGCEKLSDNSIISL
jgi:RND family efflux transporter MFP subunit